MNNVPFGFGSATDGGDDDEQPSQHPGGEPAEPGPPGGQPPVNANPFGALFGGALPPGFTGPGGELDLGAALSQLGQVFAWTGGPVNWDLARDTARQMAAGGNDRFLGQTDVAQVREAVRLAQLWLDESTAFPSQESSPVAWSRAEWIESTLPVWRSLVDPVAERVVTAMNDAITTSINGALPPMMGQDPSLSEQARAMTGPLAGMMRSMGGAMFGAQIGQALGALATEVVGSTDVGIPLGSGSHPVLVPANVAAFGADLGVPADEVRLYLALREVAAVRLYAHVPWLRARLLGAIEEYAAGIHVDSARIEQAVSGLDPSNPAAIQEALESGLLEPENTPAQEQALARLETLLALVEGWVDEVAHAAAATHLPSAAALRETVRRHRATGGPAEQTFSALVGLVLRPRRLREAAVLWGQLTQARGIEGRDAVWNHPDLLPDAEDLDSPDRYVSGAGASTTELDEGLARLLDGPPADLDRPRPDEPGDPS
ncbi:MAG: zinc-dependent metalloprotease [Actinomycetes bacterium]